MTTRCVTVKWIMEEGRESGSVGECKRDSEGVLCQGEIRIPYVATKKEESMGRDDMETQ